MTPEERNAQALRASIEHWRNGYKDIQIGDKVRITSRMLGTLYPNPSQDARVVGKLGIVTSIHARRGFGEPRCAAYYVRMLEGECAAETVIVQADERGNDMELVEKGDGTCVGGVHYPFTEDELSQQRYAAFIARVHAHDYSHQGFSNGATFLAWLYLNQESSFHAKLRELRRADGTINPLKLEREFRQRGLKIDDWAYQCPIDVPAEFAHYSIRGLQSLTRIDWQEVADQFKEKR